MSIQTHYHARAGRIVDRVMPDLPSPHGFYDPDGFVQSCRRSVQRKRLHWRVWARLRAKVEGGVPNIPIPHGCDHLYGPGNAMFDVSKELEREAAK